MEQGHYGVLSGLPKSNVKQYQLIQNTAKNGGELGPLNTIKQEEAAVGG